ncbi:MAG: hypothetical protein KJN63_08240 [Acidimicrobiia bacterium]|nr:hypothetical protein [Acidimicrobiia bacterium]
MKPIRILALLGVLAAAAAFSLRPVSPSVVFVLPRSVEAPNTIVAGNSLDLDLSLEEAGHVEVVAISAASVHVFTPQLRAGRSVWTVPEAVTRTAGRLTVRVADQESDVRVLPARPAAFTEVLVGPRTIVADGNDHSLAVVAPRDVYGNALPDETSVAFHRLMSQTDQVDYERDVGRSLAWVKLGAGTVARENSVWATLGETSGVPAVVNEVPGAASAVDLDLAETSVVADGRMVIELGTEVVVDDFGNVLPDGVAGVFSLDTGALTTVVPATVQRGRLRAFWTVPDEPAVITVTASVNGKTSVPGTLTAISGVQPFETKGQSSPDGYLITVGPLRTPSGALVADGTEANIGGRSTTTTDGVATAVVQPTPGAVSITVLGRTIEHWIRP